MAQQIQTQKIEPPTQPLPAWGVKFLLRVIQEVNKHPNNGRYEITLSDRDGQFDWTVSYKGKVEK